MKSLIQFIKESLILEGGKAVNGTPMTQTQAKAVFEDVVDKLLPKLGLFEKGTDYEALGSFGKKYENQTSGDIDIAVSIEGIAAYFGISVDEVEDKIISVCEENHLNYNYGKGIHVISLAWPIPGTKDYGSLSVFLNYYFDVKKVLDISKNVFIPKPNVDSIVVEFSKKENLKELKNKELFFKLIRDSFTQKRKTLRNNLKGYNLDKIEEVLLKYNYDLSVRAEQLSIDIFIDIANNL